MRFDAALVNTVQIQIGLACNIYIGFFYFSMHIIFQLVMIKNNLYVPYVHWFHSCDCTGWKHMIIEVTYMILWVIFAYLRGQTIVYRFRILKRVNQLLPFSLPHTTVFQYLTRRTYAVCLFYYLCMSLWRFKREGFIQYHFWHNMKWD